MDWELIFWCVLGVIALVMLIGSLFVKDDHIEMDWGKKRDIERWERKWNK